MQTNNKRKFEFPIKLYNLLEGMDKEGGRPDVVSWLPSGRGFKIHNISKFIAEILPNYYNGIKYKSFIRNINLYCFERIRNPASKDHGAYVHNMFRRGDISTCLKMVRPPNITKSRARKVKSGSEAVDSTQISSFTLARPKGFPVSDCNADSLNVGAPGSMTLQESPAVQQIGQNASFHVEAHPSAAVDFINNTMPALQSQDLTSQQGVLRSGNDFNLVVSSFFSHLNNINNNESVPITHNGVGGITSSKVHGAVNGMLLNPRYYVSRSFVSPQHDSSQVYFHQIDQSEFSRESVSEGGRCINSQNTISESDDTSFANLDSLTVEDWSRLESLEWS